MKADLTPDGVRPAYYTTDDISVIMRCCGDVARAIARSFEARGQAIRIGRRLLVPVEIFDAWRRQQDGTDVFFRVPLQAIEGGKAKEGDRRTKAAKLEEENARLRKQIEELTRPKKRGRPPKAATART